MGLEAFNKRRVIPKLILIYFNVTKVQIGKVDCRMASSFHQMLNSVYQEISNGNVLYCYCFTRFTYVSNYNLSTPADGGRKTLSEKNKI